MARCVECGYLAIRDEQGYGALEAGEQAREIGRGRTKQAELFCYARSPKFSELIDTEIDCEKCTQWRRGKTPKEHEEVTFLENVEARSVRWHEEEVKSREAWQRGIEKRYKMRLVFDLFIALLAAVITLVGAKLLPFFNLPF